MKRLIALIFVIFLLVGCTQNIGASSIDSEATSSSMESLTVDTLPEDVTEHRPTESTADPVTSGTEAPLSSEPKTEMTETLITEPTEGTEASEPGVIDPVEEYDASVVASESSDTIVIFKVTDSAGKPIQGVILRIDWDNPDGNGASSNYTDENGMATSNFHILGLGKHTVEIKEEFKINKSISYEIDVKELPAEFALIWDFGNPADIPYVPEYTGTLHFQDANGNPIKNEAGTAVFAEYFDDSDKNGEGFDSLERAGFLDENGVVVWNTPPRDTEIELQVRRADETVTTYTFTTSSSEEGNTDYYLLW